MKLFLYNILFILIFSQLAYGTGKSEIAILKQLNTEGLHFFKNNDHSKALEKWQTGLKKAQSFGNKKFESYFNRQIGWIYEDTGKYEKSLNYYQQSLNLLQKTDNKLEEANIINDIGTVYRKLGRYQKALEYYIKALSIQKQLNNMPGIGVNLTNIGVAYRNIGKYQKALEAFKISLDIKEQLKDKSGTSKVLLNIGNVYINLNQYLKALDHYEKALKIKREIGDLSGIGNCLANIGSIYYFLGKYQDAIIYYKKALDIRRKTKNILEESGNIANIGSIHYELGQYQKALEYYQEALLLQRKTGNYHWEGSILTNIGNIYSNMGQYEKSLNSYQEALSIFHKSNTLNEVGTCFYNIGLIYRSLNQLQKAFENFQNAINIFQKIGDRRSEGRILSTMGDIYDELGQHQKAQKYLNKSLSIQREIGDQKGETGTLESLALTYFGLGEPFKAIEYLKQILSVEHNAGDSLQKAHILCNIGLIYRNIGQYGEALEYVQNGLDIFKKLDSRNIWKAESALASIEIQSNQTESALNHYNQALNGIEELRTEFKQKEFKLSFMYDKFHVYDNYINLLANLHKKSPDKNYDHKAIEIFERKQSRIFLEQMGQSGARVFSGIPESIARNDIDGQIANIKNRLSNERSKIIMDQNQDVIRNSELLLNDLSKKKIALKKQLKKDYPNYFALLYPEPVSLSSLKNDILSPHDIMLIYYVMQDHIILWVVGRNDFRMEIINISESQLIDKIENYRSFFNAVITAIEKDRRNEAIHLINDTMDDINNISFSLYQLLFPKSIRQITSKAKNLYIIPTNAIYGFPFEALCTKISGDNKTIHYLLEDYTISYLSSASLLKIIRDARKHRKQTTQNHLLAFAHPEYPEVCKGQKEAEVHSIGKTRTKGYLKLMGKKTCFSKQDELPETEKEARNIAKILNVKNVNDAIQLQANASRTNVLRFDEQKRLDDYRYILFSAHAILPGEIDHINQPALVLSHPETEGYLTMADVFGLQFNADLIALSACNTGRGKHIRGEGIMGLTRAFMYAGTPTVTVTLWSVDATASYEINTRMFRNIKSGKSIADALRQAKIDLIAETEEDEDMELMKHPFFWAPFVVFGDGMEILK